VVEHLLSKHEALSSNHSTTKKKKKKKKEREKRNKKRNIFYQLNNLATLKAEKAEFAQKGGANASCWFSVGRQQAMLSLPLAPLELPL
jgi:ribosomal protein L9